MNRSDETGNVRYGDTIIEYRTLRIARRTASAPVRHR